MKDQEEKRRAKELDCFSLRSLSHVCKVYFSLTPRIEGNQGANEGVCAHDAGLTMRAKTKEEELTKEIVGEKRKEKTDGIFLHARIALRSDQYLFSVHVSCTVAKRQLHIGKHILCNSSKADGIYCRRIASVIQCANAVSPSCIFFFRQGKKRWRVSECVWACWMMRPAVPKERREWKYRFSIIRWAFFATRTVVAARCARSNRVYSPENEENSV